MKVSNLTFGLVSLLLPGLLLLGACDEEGDEGSDGADGADGIDDGGTDTGADDSADEGGDGCADDGGVSGDSGGEDCEAYNECVLASCGAEYDSCFGTDWENGNFGGTCQAYFECVFECDCDATCVQGCELGTECQNCQLDIQMCVANNCSDELMECGASSPLPGPAVAWSQWPAN